MIKWFVGCLMVAVLAGCQDSTALPDALEEEMDFIEPKPSNWAVYMKPIREYMFYRTQAVLHDDIHILWDRYPELQQNMDPEHGINVEMDDVDNLNDGFDLLDANYTIEDYERIKVKTLTDNEATVLVHGSIIYLRDDFEESGGEYLLEVFLKKKESGWTVVKTDEYTQSEYKEWADEDS